MSDSDAPHASDRDAPRVSYVMGGATSGYAEQIELQWAADREQLREVTAQRDALAIVVRETLLVYGGDIGIQAQHMRAALAKCGISVP